MHSFPNNKDQQFWTEAAGLQFLTLILGCDCSHLLSLSEKLSLIMELLYKEE